jgi:hypothetical protein
MVHALSWKYQDSFAAPAGIGSLRKFDGISHGIDANFFAWRSGFIVYFRLRLFTEGPSQLQQNGFWHEHKQVSMRVNAERMTAATLTACTLRQSV